MHLLAGRDQREYSHWSQSQALKAWNKGKVKPHLACSSPPYNEQHKRQGEKKKMTIFVRKKDQ